ncbi:hypothetical protein [Subtercola boreus]|nr:hypothetical protein [Subtercola boreus]
MTLSDAENGTHSTSRHARRTLARGVAVVVATTGLVAASSLMANAAEDTGSTDGHVAVSTAISLTGLTSDFTLTGVPGATVSELDAVAFTVETNNLAGYAVTVQAATPTLVADTAGNTDSIPIGALSVSNSADVLTPVSSAATVLVHSQGTRSVEGGDDLTNDYSVAIPFVNSDTYSVTLNYIAATL